MQRADVHTSNEDCPSGFKKCKLPSQKRWTVKIFDFGLSRIMTDSPMRDSSDARTHQKGWPQNSFVMNPSQRIFSLGVIMWELCTLGRPWDGIPPDRLFTLLPMRDHGWRFLKDLGLHHQRKLNVDQSGIWRLFRAASKRLKESALISVLISFSGAG